MMRFKHNARALVPLIFCLVLGVRTTASGETPETVTPENVLDYSLDVIGEAEKNLHLTFHGHFARGYAYFKESQFEKAIDAFQKGLAIKPDDAPITQMVAFIHAQMADYEKAVEWYRKTIELDPRAVRANERLGLALQKLNRMEDAVKAFENEIGNYPKDASPRIYLGELYLDQGRLDEANEQAGAAAKYEPLLPEPYYLLSKILRKQGKEDEAKERLKIFRQKKKEETALMDAIPVPMDDEKAKQKAAAVHIDMGIIYYQYRQYPQAESNFLAAIRFEPKNEIARNQLTKIYQATNQNQKALSLLRELAAIDGNNPDYPLRLGLLLGGFQQWKESLDCLEKAQSLAPKNLEVMRGIAKVHLASNGDGRRALAIMEYVIAEDATAENYDLLGWAYLVNQQIDRSKEALRSAVSLEPDNLKYRQRLQKLIERYGP